MDEQNKYNGKIYRQDWGNFMKKFYLETWGV